MTPIPKFRPLLRIILLGIAIPCSLLACSKPDEKNIAAEPPPYPPPGEMRLVAVEPIPSQQVASDNLILNGAIQQWWAGAPAPDGWHPPRGSYSVVTRQLNSDGDGFRARQVWSLADVGKSMSNLLYAETPDIEPNKRYRLSLTSTVTTGDRVVVSIWELKGRKWEQREPEFIIMASTNRKVTQYTRDFTSGEGRRLAVSVQSEVPKGRKTTVNWYDWSLTKIPDHTAQSQGYNETLTVRELEFLNDPDKDKRQQWLPGLPVDHLIGWWQFDQTTRFKDASGSGYTARLVKAKESTSGWWDDGRFGDAYRLAGKDYINLGTSIPENYGRTQQDITFSCWIRFSNATQSRGLFGWIRDEQGCLLALRPGPDPPTTFSINNSSWVHAASQADLRDGQWHHIGGVVNRAEKYIALYIDSELVSKMPVEEATESATPNKLVLGYNIENPDAVFDGDIDEVTVWATALSHEEIRMLYTLEGKPDPTEPDSSITTTD